MTYRTLSKATMMRRFDDIVTDRSLRLGDLRRHLAGPEAAAPYHDRLVVSTSGSTGEPALFVYSGAELAEAVAGLMRAMVGFGIGPHTRLVNIGAPSGASLSHHLLTGLSAGRTSDAPRLSVATPIPDLVRELNAYQPEAFPTVAGLAALLAEEQLAGRLRIAPRVVVCTSEVLAREALVERLGAAGVVPPPITVTRVARIEPAGGPLRKYSVVTSVLPRP